jgi:hypothetical protein
VALHVIVGRLLQGQRLVQLRARKRDHREQLRAQGGGEKRRTVGKKPEEKRGKYVRRATRARTTATAATVRPMVMLLAIFGQVIYGKNMCTKNQK